MLHENAQRIYRKSDELHRRVEQVHARADRLHEAVLAPVGRKLHKASKTKNNGGR